MLYLLEQMMRDDILCAFLLLNLLFNAYLHCHAHFNTYKLKNIIFFFLCNFGHHKNYRRRLPRRNIACGFFFFFIYFCKMT